MVAIAPQSLCVTLCRPPPPPRSLVRHACATKSTKVRRARGPNGVAANSAGDVRAEADGGTRDRLWRRKIARRIGRVLAASPLTFRRPGLVLLQPASFARNAACRGGRSRRSCYLDVFPAAVAPGGFRGGASPQLDHLDAELLRGHDAALPVPARLKVRGAMTTRRNARRRDQAVAPRARARVTYSVTRPSSFSPRPRFARSRDTAAGPPVQVPSGTSRKYRS